MSKAHAVRSAIEMLVLNGIARPLSKSPKGAILVLAYHGIVPPGELSAGERSLHLPWQQFVSHMDVLEKFVEVVSLDAVISANSNATHKKLRVAITFDDAYAGAVQYALPELAKRGFPSTVFVPTDLLGGVGFWWDRVAQRTGGEMAAATRDFAIDECAGDAELIERQLPMAEADSLPWFLRCSTEEALLASASNGNVLLAPHTARHINVAAVSDERLAQELRTSLAWCLRFPFGRPYLAFPYGRSDSRINPILKDAGIRSAFRISGGWIRHNSAPDLLSLARMNVPAKLSRYRLELKLRGYGVAT